jgi:site-specific DNA-methyltransferase (adenine-specific)
MWSTPPLLFRYLNEERNYTVDLAASPENALCRKFYTEEQDALKQSWKKERGFCNPPYTLAPEFIRKAWEEYSSSPEDTVLDLLVPVRSSNREWGKYVLPDPKTGELRCSKLTFIVGRLRFGNSDNSAPFPSVILTWEKDRWWFANSPKIETIYASDFLTSKPRRSKSIVSVSSGSGETYQRDKVLQDQRKEARSC